MGENWKAEWSSEQVLIAGRNTRNIRAMGGAINKLRPFKVLLSLLFAPIHRQTTAGTVPPEAVAVRSCPQCGEELLSLVVVVSLAFVIISEALQMVFESKKQIAGYRVI